jgi:hypothetical protein
LGPQEVRASTLGTFSVKRVGPVAVLSDDSGFVTTDGRLTRFARPVTDVKASAVSVLTLTAHPLGQLLEGYDARTGDLVFTRVLGFDQSAVPAGPVTLVLEPPASSASSSPAAGAGRSRTPLRLVAAVLASGETAPWSLPPRSWVSVPSECSTRCRSIAVSSPAPFHGRPGPLRSKRAILSLDPWTGELSRGARDPAPPPVSVSMTAGRAVVATDHGTWSPRLPALSAMTSPSRVLISSGHSMALFGLDARPLGTLSLQSGGLAGCVPAELLEHALLLSCQGATRVLGV